MNQITTHISQDIIIDSPTKLVGMISGNVSLENSTDFLIEGFINGDITVQSNSTLIVHGTINGNIINAGLVKIFGRINGKLIENGGSFEIDPKAIIKTKES